MRANRVKLSRFLHRMRTVKTAAAFARWDENRLEMKRQRHVMSRAEEYFQRASSRSVTKAFNAWAKTRRMRKRMRRALERILSRWQRLQLAAPFGDWVDWVDEVQRNRLKVSRFLHRMHGVLGEGVLRLGGRLARREAAEACDPEGFQILPESRQVGLRARVFRLAGQRVRLAPH